MGYMLQSNDSELRRLESRIRTINDMAQIQRATRSNVSTDWVLGVGGFDLKRYEDEVNIPPPPPPLLPRGGSKWLC